MTWHERACPQRRWFRFSLRTVFVVVTVAAGLAYYLRPYPFEVHGNLTRQDVQSICRCVAQDTRTKTWCIYSIFEFDESANVYFDPEGGATPGNIRMAALKKQHGVWIFIALHPLSESGQSLFPEVEPERVHDVGLSADALLGK